MKIEKLRTNHLGNPIGYDLSEISLSWTAKSSGKKQEASRIRVAEDKEFLRLVSDSGYRKLDSLGHIPVDKEGLPLKLKPFTRYYWDVSVRADDGDEGVSETAYFETGRCGKPWTGKWITAPFEEHPVFRGTFQAEKGKKARICLCAAGLYEVWCNGKKVTEEVLLPGYHSYDLQLMYQTFVLDDFLCGGVNEITVMLGKGWYMGRFGFGKGVSDIYGDRMALICEIYVDGKLEAYSGRTWVCRKSPILDSNIYDGEVWDARLEDYGEWTRAEYLETKEADSMTGRLTERVNPPVTIVEKRKPAEILTTPGGDTVLDFGQNLAGWFVFECDLPEGQEVSVDCAELMQDGEFYRENLRTARASLTYISKGTKESVRPHFTFFGFRYLRVRGIVDLEKAGFEAWVLSSVSDRTGFWETSDQKVNRLIENARWGQISNFIDLPTDCPQRDERMGWTGDAQIFCATACYHYDTAAFYAKYMKDMYLEQCQIGGSVPFVVPSPKVDLMPGARQSSGSCAWSDAAVIIPWTLYLFYGDKMLLKREYPGMKACVDYIRTQETKDHLWNSGFHFADWLALDNSEPGPMGKTDPYYCASGYYYYSTLLTAKAAKALGYEADAVFYRELSEKIRISVQKKYFGLDGLCLCDTQTADVLALEFGLCRDEDREKIAYHLHDKLEANGMHLDTGFIGTGYLCKSLAQAGRNEDAVSLLLQEDMPGWLYQVRMGATTIWERWDSILPDGHINPEGMNSLNHYANGSVCRWIYEELCGLSPLEPGFRKALFCPKPDRRLEFVKGNYKSAAGTYECGWERRGDEYMCHIKVPFDCLAVVRIQGHPVQEIEAGEYEFLISDTVKDEVMNPYLPLWEYVPDAEPRVFGDRVYVYGSHDAPGTEEFCVRDYVVWSAPLDDLGAWRYEGVSYTYKQTGETLEEAGNLAAPDCVKGLDGRYYLYYNRGAKNACEVAVSDRPQGPFEYIGNVVFPDGTEPKDKLFDPGVLVDDDGKIYLYTGFVPTPGSPWINVAGRYSQAFELEKDMRTIRQGPVDVLPGCLAAKGTEFEGHAFYEASSPRKIGGKYYLVYSSEQSHDLCYAVSDKPLEGFRYRGVIVSNADIGYAGNQKPKTPYGNTHGGLAEIKGQWYIFYHRQTHGIECCRQGCAEPVFLNEKGDFDQVEMTSCGLNGGPLRGIGTYSAAYACNLMHESIGKEKLTVRKNVRKEQPHIFERKEEGQETIQYIANIQKGTVVGFKYFNLGEANKISMVMDASEAGVIGVYLDEKCTEKAAELAFGKSDKWQRIQTNFCTPRGVFPLYFRLESDAVVNWKEFTLR